MWKRWVAVCVASVFMLAAAQSATAQTVQRYILRTKSANLLDVVARQGLTIIQVLRDDGTDATVVTHWARRAGSTFASIPHSSGRGAPKRAPWPATMRFSSSALG